LKDHAPLFASNPCTRSRASCPKSTHSLGSHVRARINAFLRILRHLGIEALLDFLEDILVGLAADEGDAETLCAEAAGATDAVEVGVGIGGEVVIDGQVDAFNVNTSAKDIGGDADSLVEFFEFLVALDTDGDVSK
jgi:hypothetical protein